MTTNEKSCIDLVSIHRITTTTFAFVLHSISCHNFTHIRNATSHNHIFERFFIDGLSLRSTKNTMRESRIKSTKKNYTHTAQLHASCKIGRWNKSKGLLSEEKEKHNKPKRRETKQANGVVWCVCVRQMHKSENIANNYICDTW